MAEINQIDFGDGVTRDLSDATSRVLLPATVGWTGKNLLPSTAVAQSLSGVTFTVNSDKSVTLTNSANAAFTYVIFEGSIEIPANCVFSAGRIPASSTQIYVVVDGTAYYVPADGTFVEIPSGTLTYCKIYGNQYFAPQSAVTYYPMIYDKRITDLTYEPYHESVEECKVDSKVVEIATNSDLAKLKEGLNAVWVKAGMTIGINESSPITLATGGRGYVTMQNSSLAGIIGAYDGSYVYYIASSEGRTNVQVCKSLKNA